MDRAGRGLSYLLLLAGLVAAGEAVRADCFFIGLRGFAIEKNPDLLLWGELAPLLALEPGRFYPLAPRRMASLDAGGGERSDLQGQLYYIPRHLIDLEGRFSLRMLVVDPDKDTADDTLLPLSERQISLAPESFDTDSRRVTLRYRPFADLSPPTSNAMQFSFEIRRRSGDCDSDSAPGRAADLDYRRQNELQRLLVRVVSYERPHLLGGRETRPYRLAEVKARDFPEARDRALDIADVNARELIDLGRAVQDLAGADGFDEVWEEYILLVQRLARQHLGIQYRRDGVQQRMRLPSLRFHPGWAELDSGDDRPLLPPAWKIKLPQD
jgi:hypothetical protein